MNNKQYNTIRSMKPTSEKDLLEKNTQRIEKALDNKSLLSTGSPFFHHKTKDK